MNELFGTQPVPASQPRSEAFFQDTVPDYTKLFQPDTLEDMSKLDEQKMTEKLAEIQKMYGRNPAMAEKMTVATGDQVYVTALAQAKEGKPINWQTPVGQRFIRFLKKANNKQDYETAKEKGEEEKKQFQLEWMNDELEKSKKKSFGQTRSMTHVEEGRYMPFGGLVVKQGGWESPMAVRAATIQAMKCSLLGPPWTDFNEWTDTLEFFDIDRKKIDTFKTSWQIFQDQMGSSNSP